MNELTELLQARESERDSAQLALAAATSGLEDATVLLDTSNADLRELESEIDEVRGRGGDPGVLESNLHSARDTVAACQVAVHEATRVVLEYTDEVAALDAVVSELRQRVAEHE